MITLSNVGVTFSGEDLFQDVSFLINKSDRIGLVGKNGAGKSTLLKLIYGLEAIDYGSISKAKNVTIGYLPQELKNDSQLTVWEEALKGCEDIEQVKIEIEKVNKELMTRTDYESDDYADIIERSTQLQEKFALLGGDKIEGKVEQVLQGLGFQRDEFIKSFAALSGGWKMRVELAKLLLATPDCLLLDEPTNHLDIVSIQWLENFLRNYPGGILLISHDKSFLDGLVTKTFEIANKRIYDYSGNYSKFLQLREERMELLVRSKQNQDKEIAETEKFIERFRYKATKSKQVQSRIKQLEKVERIELDNVDETNFNIRFPEAPRSGKVVIKAEKVGISFGDKDVFHDLGFELERGHKVALLGKNGEGKSTLIKMITGEYKGDGSIELGHNVSMSYYAQNQADLLDFNKTVFETIDDVAEGEIRKKVRTLLGTFLFSDEDVEKKVSVLSGGEKARLALCKMMLSPTNFLILDEPTNHLDIASKNRLKESIKAYTGSVIIVSHDRDFLDGLTEKVWQLKDGQIKEHLGDVSLYLEKLKEELQNETLQKQETKQVEKTASSNKERFERKKELDKQYRKINNRISKLEKEIEDLEASQKELEKKVYEGDQSQELFDQLADIQKNLTLVMKEWEEKSYELEITEEERSEL